MANDAAGRDAALLLDMLLAARDAIGFVAGPPRPASAPLLPSFPWPELMGMCHPLIHGYAGAGLGPMWAVVREPMPPLIAMLEPLVPPETGERTP